VGARLSHGRGERERDLKHLFPTLANSVSASQFSNFGNFSFCQKGKPELLLPVLTRRWGGGEVERWGGGGHEYRSFFYITRISHYAAARGSSILNAPTHGSEHPKVTPHPMSDST
jgi:hypothetical protein